MVILPKVQVAGTQQLNTHAPEVGFCLFVCLILLFVVVVVVVFFVFYCCCLFLF